METEIYMPIRAHPYDHQRRAFEFALRVFGVLREEGDENADGFEKKKEGDAHDSNQ